MYQNFQIIKQNISFHLLFHLKFPLSIRQSDSVVVVYEYIFSSVLFIRNISKHELDWMNEVIQ